jgi:hypothetical protein
MRKILFAAILLATLVAAAEAQDWGLQIRGEYLHYFLTDPSWQSLYAKAPVDGLGFRIDSELAVGVGPYFRLGGLWATRDNIPGGINAEWTVAEGALGVNYRYHPTVWFAPSAHVGCLYFEAGEKIFDDTFTYKMHHDGFGLDAGIDLDFYPFGVFRHSGARGLLLSFGAGYQMRPLADMGALTSASGWNINVGFGYRIDLTPRRPRPQPPAPIPADAPPSAPPAPTPVPPPAPPAPDGGESGTSH